MPSTTVVVACVVGLSLLLVLILVARGRRKAAEPETPRFEPPRELAPRPAKTETKAAASEPATQEAPLLPSVPVPVAKATEAHAPPPAPATEQAAKVEEPTPPSTEVIPPSVEAIVTDQVIETATEAPASAPPAPRAGSTPGAPRRAMPSYSDISDESVAEAIRRESLMPSPPEAVAVEMPAPEVPAARPEPAVPIADAEVAAARPALSEPKAPVAPKPPTSVARVPAAKPAVSEPRVPVAAKPAVSEPRVPVAAKPAVSEPRVPVAAKPAVSEPRVPVTAKPAVSEPRVPVAAKPVVSEPRVQVAPKPAQDEHDFSALNDAPAAKPTGAAAAAAAAAATVAKFAPPPNPATADLEKNDPRHAAARRFARVSVSEIKLYHEDEVKAGREAKDLWKRLQQDIALARQTFDARVVPEVRQRFDYLLDEIIRQLAEGDASKLGPDAPALANTATTTENATSSPTAAPPPINAAASGNIIDPEAPTRTVRRTLEPAEPTPSKAEVVETPKPKPIEPAAAPAKPAEAGKPTGLAARALPSNPETAELEKNDPRHAAARRLARLSVSEIKLYHEDEVKAGREAKDLWKRMSADIGLATQTYEKRVDKEVRDRFDYLYDEILRQLAEGDASKLGPDAPKPKKAEAAAPAAEAPAPPSPPPAAAPAAAPVPATAAPKAEAPKPAAPASGASPAARYAPPSNPATAELEKNDPRHAAARRLARLSVSEIKLYHEDEVKAGREAKDLWKRLITDIGLATQTFEKRVDKEVRDRFDYLYDEILRQLAEGDVSKLGPDAPKPKADT